VLLCVEKSCYVKAGQEALPVLEQEEERFTAVLSEIDNECLADAAEHHRQMAEEYTEAARAATAGDVGAVEAAVARADDQEIAFVEKLGSCGFSAGRIEEIASELRTARTEVIRLAAKFNECSSPSCADSVARRLKKTAHAATRHIDEYMAEIDEAGPDDEQKTCIKHGLTLARRAYKEYEKAANAILSRDYQAAERHSLRSQELSAQGSETTAACFG
jgi:hypothetical protein